MSKTGPKPTTKQCELCDDTFYSKSNFKRHIINVHKFNGSNEEIDKLYKKYLPKKKVIIKKITKPLLDNELEQYDNNDITIINEAIKEIKDNISDIQSLNNVISDHDIKIEGILSIKEQMYDKINKFDSEIYHNSINFEYLNNQVNQYSTMLANLMKQINEQSKQINEQLKRNDEQSKEINMLKEQLANLKNKI